MRPDDWHLTWPVAPGATVVGYMLPEDGPVRYIAPGPFDCPAQPPITW